MASSQVPRVPALARLNRLPIIPFYKRLTWLLGLVFFFDFADNNTLSFASPAILRSWHLSVSTIGVLISATFGGMFVGSMLGGYVSDRIGRKKTLLFSTLWYSVFSLLNGLMWNTTGLFLTRMLTGVGISAMTVVGITYISEIYPARVRGAYQGWIMAIGLCGVPITAYVARFCIPAVSWGWRLVFLWGSLGMIIPVFSRLLEESPRWYENHERLEEADAVLNRLEEEAREQIGSLPPVPVPPASEGGFMVPLRGRASELFRAPQRTRTLVLTLTWICMTLGFYGFTSWVPTLLVAHGFSLVNSLAWSSAISLATVPGALIAGLTADRWSRKWLIVGVASVIAICGLAYGLSFHRGDIIIFGFLVEMFLHTFSPLLYTYTAESFPTEIRNSGTGFAYGAGRITNILGPLIVAFLFNRFGYMSVFVYIAASWVVLALMIAGLTSPQPRGLHPEAVG